MWPLSLRIPLLPRVSNGGQRVTLVHVESTVLLPLACRCQRGNGEQHERPTWPRTLSATSEKTLIRKGDSPMPKAKPDTLLTVSEVAERLGVSIWTVRRLVRAGELPATDVGAGQAIVWRISESAVTRFVARRTEPGTH